MRFVLSLIAVQLYDIALALRGLEVPDDFVPSVLTLVAFAVIMDGVDFFRDKS